MMSMSRSISPCLRLKGVHVLRHTHPQLRQHGLQDWIRGKPQMGCGDFQRDMAIAQMVRRPQ